MPKDVILTADGLEKLKAELALLQGEKRKEVAQRIKEAREFGDITENSEYDDAKNEQAMVEARIAQVEERLRSATVVDAKDVSTEVVQVGYCLAVAALTSSGHGAQPQVVRSGRLRQRPEIRCVTEGCIVERVRRHDAHRIATLSTQPRSTRYRRARIPHIAESTSVNSSWWPC